VTGGTAALEGRRSCWRSKHSSVTASEEITVRHALVATQLLHEARSADGTVVPERQLEDAPPDPPVTTTRSHRRRLATLFRRARVRALGLGAESPGGGA
jgi:hypothetical protein